MQTSTSMFGTPFAGKVLVILSDADKFAVQKSDGTVTSEDTGFFLTELAKPLGQILDAGFEVVVRSKQTFVSLS